MPPHSTRAGRMVREARQSGRFAPEALRAVRGAPRGGTFMARIQQAAATLPPAQANNLLRKARNWRQNQRGS